MSRIEYAFVNLSCSGCVAPIVMCVSFLFEEHYIRGMVALDDEQWQVVVDQLERAVSGFFVEVDRCCVDCEDELWLTDTTHFSGIVAGQKTSTV